MPSTIDTALISHQSTTVSAMARINRQTSYQKAQEIEFSTSSADPLAAWRISGNKGTAWEQWYFDSIADDAQG